MYLAFISACSYFSSRAGNIFYLLIIVIFLLYREDFDVGGMLLCPSGQENLVLGLRYGKAEAIGGR